MKFYGDVDDHIVFGDEYYWGDYSTIDGIWKRISWWSNKNDLNNQKIQCFLKNCRIVFSRI
jgi:hypothetical protein